MSFNSGRVSPQLSPSTFLRINLKYEHVKSRLSIPVADRSTRAYLHTFLLLDLSHFLNALSASFNSQNKKLVLLGKSIE